jgi:predicted HD phosphohydrolase
LGRKQSVAAAAEFLLAQAARTISVVRVEVVDGEGYVNRNFAHGSIVYSGNPLTCSGNALDLAVRSRLEIYLHEWNTCAMTADLKLANELHGDDANAATRRTITRSRAKS